MSAGSNLDCISHSNSALQEMFAYPQLSMGDFSMAPLSMVMSLSMPGLAIPFTTPAPSAQNSAESQEEMPVPSPSPGIFVATPTTAPSVFPSSASTNTGDTNAVETNANDARSEDSSGLSKGGRTATIVILVAAAAMAAGFLAYRRQKGSSASGASVTSSLLSGGVNDVAPAV